MTKSTAKALKGLTAGVATGMLVGYMGKNMTDNKQQIKKKANKAMETFGDVIDTVSYMFKQRTTADNVRRRYVKIVFLNNQFYYPTESLFEYFINTFGRVDKLKIKRTIFTCFQRAVPHMH